MLPKIIKIEKDYDRALDRINDLMDAEPGTSEEEELKKVVSLVEQYEKERHPMDPPEQMKE